MFGNGAAWWQEEDKDMCHIASPPPPPELRKPVHVGVGGREKRKAGPSMAEEEEHLGAYVLGHVCAMVALCEMRWLMSIDRGGSIA